jgi:maltodextrin utilization protein YvdJ
MISPKTEDRPMTDEELDKLLEGFDGDGKKITGKKRMIIKNGQRIFVPVEEKEEYIQNEEQSDDTIWNKTKELDIPEPEKNEIILPTPVNTIEEESIPEIAESITIEEKIPVEKFENYKKRITNEEDYHQRVEKRLDEIITKLEANEIKLSELTSEDQTAILTILNQKNG